MTNRQAFEEFLKEAVKFHGHLCPGQVLGVRMAMYGIEKVGSHDPKGRNKKKLYLFVEIDRCATDALQSVTGCSLGQRTMRFMDFGKMAATFVNLETGISVRVVAKEEAREKAKNYFPWIKDRHKCQIEAYKMMPDDELFYHESVYLNIPEQDLPGPPLRRVRCERCGEYVQDMREVYRDGKIMCRPCANGEIYFSTLRYPQSIAATTHGQELLTSIE